MTLPENDKDLPHAERRRLAVVQQATEREAHRALLAEAEPQVLGIVVATPGLKQPAIHLALNALRTTPAAAGVVEACLRKLYRARKVDYRPKGSAGGWVPR
jgi:hypothetical protein